MTAILPPVSSRTRVARRASTTASGSTSHIIDTGLSTFATDYWNGNLVAMRTGSAKGATRTITDFDGTKTLTVSPALPASPGTSELYEIFTDKSSDLELSGQIDAVNRLAGKYQVFEKSITSGATAGTTTVATITTQPCLIESVVLHADANQTPALTSAAVQGGDSGVVTFIDATDGAAANINVVDEQVGWTGAVRLAATKTIIMDLVGTGATAVDLTVTIGYRACVDDGYLV